MLGTLAWAERDRGRTTLGDRLRIIGQGIAVTLRGTKRSAEAKLADAVRAPTGELAAWAEATCGAVSAPWLVNHCLRSFAFGAVLAARDGVTVDAELLWLAAMLHDLGITEAHRAPDGTCFAYHGAVVARGMLEERRFAGAARVAEAICQHLNVRPLADAPPEVRYLAAATALDTVGMRAAEIADDRDRIDARWPRLGMRDALVETMGARAIAENGTRLSLLCKLGFLRRVKKF